MGRSTGVVGGEGWWVVRQMLRRLATNRHTAELSLSRVGNSLWKGEIRWLSKVLE